jgi:hypothetical protein
VSNRCNQMLESIGVSGCIFRGREWRGGCMLVKTCKSMPSMPGIVLPHEFW